MASKIDPEEERQRLACIYAEMPDLQLEELAAVAETLTDPARDALRHEISLRKLDVALHAAEPPIDHTLQEYVVLRSFRDLPLAQLAQAALDAEGIESFLYDENMVRMYWLWSYAVGGVKLLVRKDEATEALEILNQAPAEKFSTDSGEFVQPSCPQCGSFDVLFRGLQKRLAYATVLVGIPIPVSYTAWKCNSCSNAWKESAGATGTEGSGDSNGSADKLP